MPGAQSKSSNAIAVYLADDDLNAVGNSATGGLNVVSRIPSSVGTDRSVTASTTSSQLMAANTARTKFFVKNDTGIVVWINFGATAGTTAGGGNIQIAANGGYFEFTGYTGAINIIAASTTAAVTAREF